jgi:hypothetical protein
MIVGVKSHLVKGMVTKLSTIISDDVLIGNLEEAVQNIDAQKEEAEREYHSRLDSLTERESLLRTTLEGLRGSTNGSSPTPSSSSRLSVSDERLDKVKQYLKEHPRSKQTDLVKKLGFNSGTVSVALRLLEQNGEAKRIESDESSGKPGRRSQVWDSSSKKGRRRVPA